MYASIAYIVGYNLIWILRLLRFAQNDKKVTVEWQQKCWEWLLLLVFQGFCGAQQAMQINNILRYS